MTQNRKQAKAIRLRMTETGESYMQARRQLEDSGASGEPHYVLHRVRGTMRVEGGRHRLVTQARALWTVEQTGAWWGYGGSGPTTTAKTILDDALGVDADLIVSRGFKSDVLARLDGEAAEARITLAEVRAWWDERRPTVLAEVQANRGSSWEPVDLRDLARTMLNDGPRFRWLKERRTQHPPDFGPNAGFQEPSRKT